MKTADAHIGIHTKPENSASLWGEELSIDAFCQRMSARFHKVWCVNHGQDYEKTVEKQSFHREDYMRS